MASLSVLYAPKINKIKEPDMPGRIIAQIAIAPAIKRKYGLLLLAKGGSVVI